VAELTFEYIRELILADTTCVHQLPKSMLQRAEWARAAIENPEEHEIDFGRYGSEHYTIAVHCPEDGYWYDVAGHYHVKSPSQSLLDQAEKSNRYKAKQEALLKAEQEALAEYGFTNIKELRREYYEARADHPRICVDCGQKEEDKKLHWHHHDPEMGRQMNLWLTDAKEIDPLEQWDEFFKQYENYIGWAVAYYCVAIEDTTLLCPKCHRAAHKALKEQGNVC